MRDIREIHNQSGALMIQHRTQSNLCITTGVEHRPDHDTYEQGAVYFLRDQGQRDRYDRRQQSQNGSVRSWHFRRRKTSGTQCQYYADHNRTQCNSADKECSALP